MNDKQKYLLKLLKEIDKICKENDIRYYLAAGTMLGAIRHRGFIPWDDDADIIMTKKNYDRFVGYFSEHKVENREFQYRGNNPRYPMIIGRYYDKESTGVQRGTGWDIVPAGQYIDVMILIPLPNDEKLKKKTIDRIILYVELNNDMYTDNGNRGDAYTKKYKRALRLRKLIGKERLLKWLERKIFCFSEETCNEFMISHAIGSTLTFKKEFFGKPEYVPFEDTKLPIAQNYLDLFWYGYGSAWRMIPPQNEQETHTVIDDFERPYPLYVNDYMRFLDKETVLRDVRNFKITSVLDTNRKRPFSKGIHLMDAVRVKLSIEEHIGQQRVNLDDLIRERQFNKINDIFRPYYNLQFRHTFLYWNLYLDLGDELLYYPLYNWIFFTGEYYRARKVLGLRQREKGDLPVQLQNLEHIISMITEAYYAYDYKDYDKLDKLVQAGHSKYPDQLDFWLLHLWLLEYRAEEQSDYEHLLKEALQALELFPRNGDCMRYVADGYCKLGQWDKAFKFYEFAETFTSNGETLLYIKDVKEELKW